VVTLFTIPGMLTNVAILPACAKMLAPLLAILATVAVRALLIVGAVRIVVARALGQPLAVLGAARWIKVFAPLLVAAAALRWLPALTEVLDPYFIPATTM
jgi:hypothetical protein